jgi:hypothetical protein
MSFLRIQRSTLPGIALALMLVAAQCVVAMHDLRHESGTAQNQVCTTCVAASQLAAAAVDTGALPVTTDTYTVFNAARAISYFSTQILAPRPRGPPSRL